jgi:hypothetical protein
LNCHISTRLSIRVDMFSAAVKHSQPHLYAPFRPPRTAAASSAASSSAAAFSAAAFSAASGAAAMTSTLASAPVVAAPTPACAPVVAAPTPASGAAAAAPVISAAAAAAACPAAAAAAVDTTGAMTDDAADDVADATTDIAADAEEDRITRLVLVQQRFLKIICAQYGGVLVGEVVRVAIVQRDVLTTEHTCHIVVDEEHFLPLSDFLSVSQDGPHNLDGIDNLNFVLHHSVATVPIDLNVDALEYDGKALRPWSAASASSQQYPLPTVLSSICRREMRLTRSMLPDAERIFLNQALQVSARIQRLLTSGWRLCDEDGKDIHPTTLWLR